MENTQHINPDPEFQVTAFLIRDGDKTVEPGLYSFEIRSEIKFCRAGLYLEAPGHCCSPHFTASGAGKQLSHRLRA